jgi:hypothetical protein
MKVVDNQWDLVFPEVERNSSVLAKLFIVFEEVLGGIAGFIVLFDEISQ